MSWPAAFGSVESVFPGFREHIEEIEVATPLIISATWLLRGAITVLTIYERFQYVCLTRSPIQGLYFAGAWAGSGGFQPTLSSGLQQPRQIVKYAKSNGGEVA
jgi:prolycopene isomerase